MEKVLPKVSRSLKKIINGVSFLNLHDSSSELFESRTQKLGSTLSLVEINQLEDNEAARLQPILTPKLAYDIRKSIIQTKPFPMPVFIIQCHGLYSTDLQLVPLDKKDNYAIRWKRGGEKLIKMAQPGQWIINTTPMDAVGLCTQLENKFVTQMGEKLGNYRNCLLSARAPEVLSMRPAHVHHPLVNPYL